MSTLLVQSCSASKRESSSPMPAIELYDGYFYKIINKSRREDAFRDDLHLRILSAKHGILGPTEEITTYDRRMTADRAAELRESVLASLVETTEELGVGHVVINAAAEYRAAVEGLETRLEGCTVSYITGQGNGEMGSKLKSFIRADEQSEMRA